MSILLPEVTSGWCAWTRQFEGRVAWPYLDTHTPDPIVTVGLGCAVLSDDDFRALPWVKPTGEAATPEECDSAWRFLKTMNGGRVATTYAYPGHLRLDDSEIDALALRRLESNAEAVARLIPELSTMPAAAQTLCMSHAWAMGTDWPRHWPRLVAALRAGDWAACVAPTEPARFHPYGGRPMLECEIAEQGNLGVVSRNVAVVALLRGLVS